MVALSPSSLRVSTNGFRGRAGEFGNRGRGVLFNTGRGVEFETGLPLAEDDDDEASLLFVLSLGICNGEADDTGGLGKLPSDAVLGCARAGRTTSMNVPCRR